MYVCMYVCINRLFFEHLCKNKPTTTIRLCHQYRVICAWCTCKVKRENCFVPWCWGARSIRVASFSLMCVGPTVPRVWWCA